MLDVLKQELVTKNYPNEFNAPMHVCMWQISLKIKKYLPSLYTFVDLQQVSDVLMLNGMNWDSLQYLDFIENLSIDEHFSVIIQLKLLWVISYFLNKQLYKFHIRASTFDLHREFLEKFQGSLEQKMKKVSAIDEKTISICLTCLSKFSFKYFADQMVRFSSSLF